VVPVDVAALTTAVSELNDDRAIWERASRAGFEAVIGHHTPAAYAERLEGVYAEAMAKAAAR
jgi:glycosyltransferase involved in cell wall biosynthesis